ncbi:hypothetical protein ACIQU3_36445 [Streptomyces sp. NPDC101110]|uniref:hypothetical protein n=1 Tax=Streptomyces sp. NPDC101110 TaxID=3366104 RepID=UPI00382E495A
MADKNTLVSEDQIHDTTWIGVVVSVGDISAERFGEFAEDHMSTVTSCSAAPRTGPATAG